MLAISNDNTIEWDEMTDPSGAYINDATVTAVLKDSADVAVQSGISLAYIAASDGKYRGTISSTNTLTLGNTYHVEVTATSGTDNGFRRLTEVAEYRAYE